MKVNATRKRPAKATAKIDTVTTQHIKLNACFFGYTDSAADVFYAPRRLAQKVKTRANIIQIYRAVAFPIQPVKHVLVRSVTAGMVLRDKNGIERQGLGFTCIAMLGNQIRRIWWRMGIELEMGDVNVRRYLLLPGTLGINGQDAPKITVRTNWHQIADLVTQFDQRFTQIPDHTLGAAVGIDWDGGVVDQ